MRDPTTTTDTTKWLIEVTIQYLCQRELLELNEALNRSFAISRARFLRGPKTRGWRPPARRKRGRPSMHELHLQIAGAVAMLVEDYGRSPLRSRAKNWHHATSACSIVTAALEQKREYMGDYLGEYRSKCLGERMVESIWNKYRLSSQIFHQGATDYARTHKDRVEA
jgi:hypothetical protein